MTTAYSTASSGEAGMHADAEVPTGAESRRFRRRAEIWLASTGMAGAAALQGGFTLVVQRSDEAAITGTVVPALQDAGFAIPAADAEVVLGTLAAWFGFSLVLMGFLFAIGVFIASRRPRRRRTGWWFFATGVVCLFGTQMLLYPVAFLFFLAAGLFAVRSLPQDRSTS